MHFAPGDSGVLTLEHIKGFNLTNLDNQITLRLGYFVGDVVEYYETGAIDTKDRFFIHLWRERRLAFTHVCAFPSAELPLYVGTRMNSSTKIFGSAFPGITGKEISQTETISRKLFVNIPVLTLADTCYEITGHTTNHQAEIGVYRWRFIYNNRLGFVKLTYYKPGGDSVLIQLDSTRQRSL